MRMKPIAAPLFGIVTALVMLASAASPGPTAPAPLSVIPPPLDKPYPGELRLAVDATDLERRVVHVHETLTGVGPDCILLYPKWLPGTHAPEGPIDRLAGLRITANGVPVTWTRDPVDVFAFHVHAAAGVKAIDIDFDYLSPTSSKVGPLEMSPEILIIEWNEVVLYPAGYYTRRIPTHATLTLPHEWQYGSALRSASTGGVVPFDAVPLETLVDSPVYAGKHAVHLDLDPGAAVPVTLNLFADRADLLVVKPDQLEAHRNLVRQAYKLFGSHHYSHYDFLYSLSEQVVQNGLEHHQSSEDGGDPASFVDWEGTAFERDLLPHEFTHSWNGKFRRPWNLWTPNYDVPMQDSLLWVYEGQTQYWGQVLAARSHLWTLEEARDQLAMTAAYYQNEAGRRWRPLEDTTHDEIINPRRPMAWPNWQRFEDYYEEGQLIWLEADTLIREESHGQRSLDDFAHAFFGIDDGSFTPVTYTFEDIVKALNAVQPYDWTRFLRDRLDQTGRPAPLAGLQRGGYQLIYNDTQNELSKKSDQLRKRVSLPYSIGVTVDDKDANVLEVQWDSPAAKAGVIEGATILAVNGAAFTGDNLKAAIQSARDAQSPIELILKVADRFRVARIDYHGGLRYPHLERDPATPALLDEILKPR